MKCSKCGAEVASGRFCPECGNEVVTMEMVHQEKIELAKKYADKIPSSTAWKFHVKGDIPSNKINNAISAYAPGIDRNTIVVLFDTTVFENGKEGMIFTDNEICYKEYLKPAVRLMYSDIKEAHYTYIELKNGEHEHFDADKINARAFREFFNELLSVDRKYRIQSEKKKKLTKLDVMEKYGRKLSDYDFYLKGTIPDKRLKNAISKYAGEVSRENVLGLIDTTLMDNGKKGVLFTRKAMYQNIEEDFHRKLYYDDITDVEDDDNGYKVKISYYRDDGERYYNSSRWFELDHKVFIEFLKEMAKAE